jgi:hypothetical protein
MAHFVALVRYPPSPEDDIDVIRIDKAGNAKVGLWGFMDGATECVVKITGPGTATPGKQYGKTTQEWTLSGLSDVSLVQAYSGMRPFTGIMKVAKESQEGSLKERNKGRLESESETDRAKINGAYVEAIPLEKGFGNSKVLAATGMRAIHGLAVHITAGSGKAAGGKANFEARNASTHFIIDRSGAICQYVACSIMAHAQGPGNPHFLSVEMVGSASGASCQSLTDAQIGTGRALWGWVRSAYPGVPNKLARAFKGKKDGGIMGYGADKLYNQMAEKLGDSPLGSGTADSIAECINSMGLSCHWWLDNTVKSCPGIGIMGQLPQILGCADRIAVEGDSKLMLA